MLYQFQLSFDSKEKYEAFTNALLSGSNTLENVRSCSHYHSDMGNILRDAFYEGKCVELPDLPEEEG